MDAHSWLDVFGYVLTGAVTLIAVFLAYLLNRHAEERKGISEALAELRQDLGKVKGWIAGKFGIQL